jgi:hypothetical protein
VLSDDHLYFSLSCSSLGGDKLPTHIDGYLIVTGAAFVAWEEEIFFLPAYCIFNLLLEPWSIFEPQYLMSFQGPTNGGYLSRCGVTPFFNASVANLRGLDCFTRQP